MSSGVYAPSEIPSAVMFALAVQVALLALLVSAGSGAKITAKEDAEPAPVSIAVRPVLDDLPLLKKGGKPNKGKLPDMWRKPPPVKRYKDVAAPSPLADKSPPPLGSSAPLAKTDEAVPPPEAEVAKEVDELTPETDIKPEEVVSPEEGAADGIEEGTEADPTKARALSLYQQKLISWFVRRFRQPTEIDCVTLKGLRAQVAALISPDRTVLSYSIKSPSGNASFDAQVKATMDATIGEEIPPPPQNYPEMLQSTVFPQFSGQNANCTEARSAPAGGTTPEQPNADPAAPPAAPEAE